MAAEKVTLRIFDLEMDRVLPVRAETEWSIKQITRGIKKHREDLHSGAWKLQRNGEDLGLQRPLAEYLDQWGITEDTDVRLVLKHISVSEAVRIGMMRLAPGIALETAQAAVDAQVAALKAERATKHAASEMEAEQPAVPPEDAEIESAEAPAEPELTPLAQEEPAEIESLEQFAEPMAQESPAQPPVVESDDFELTELEPADEPIAPVEESGADLELLAEEPAPVAEPEPVIDEDEDEEPGSVAALLAQMEQETEGEEDIAEPLAPIAEHVTAAEESPAEEPAPPAMAAEAPAPIEPAAVEQQPEAEEAEEPAEPETEEPAESDSVAALLAEIEEEEDEPDIIEPLAPIAETPAAVEEPAFEETTPVTTEPETPLPPASEPTDEEAEPTPPAVEKPEEDDDLMSLMSQLEEDQEAAPAPETEQIEPAPAVEEPVAEVAPPQPLPFFADAPEEPAQKAPPTETPDAAAAEPDAAEWPPVEEAPAPPIVHVAPIAPASEDETPASPVAPVEPTHVTPIDAPQPAVFADDFQFPPTPAVTEEYSAEPATRPLATPAPQSMALPPVPASFIDTTDVDISLGDATPSTEVRETDIETTDAMPNIGAGELEIALGESHNLPESEIAPPPPPPTARAVTPETDAYPVEDVQIETTTPAAAEQPQQPQQPPADESTNDMDAAFAAITAGTTIGATVAAETVGEDVVQSLDVVDEAPVSDAPVAAGLPEDEATPPTGDNVVVAQASASYMGRMRKAKWHPLQVTVSGETGHPSQAPESQLTIRPVFVGCSVNPSSRLVPLSGRKQEAQFSVRAESTGKLPEARIDLHLPGRKVGVIETPAACVGGIIPRTLTILGLLAFAGLFTWMAYTQVDWTQWPGENIWNGLLDVLLTVGWIPWAVLGASIFLSIVLGAVAFRPRRVQTETRSVPLERTG